MEGKIESMEGGPGVGSVSNMLRFRDARVVDAGTAVTTVRDCSRGGLHNDRSAGGLPAPAPH